MGGGNQMFGLVWLPFMCVCGGGIIIFFSVTYNVNAKFSLSLHLDKDWKNREYRD